MTVDFEREERCMRVAMPRACEDQDRRACLGVVSHDGRMDAPRMSRSPRSMTDPQSEVVDSLLIQLDSAPCLSIALHDRFHQSAILAPLCIPTAAIVILLSLNGRVECRDRRWAHDSRCNAENQTIVDLSAVHRRIIVLK